MRVIKINKFVQEEEKITWLIRDLLPDVGWTLLYGMRGLGKTTFAVQMCAALEAGLPFLGRETVKTSTLYIQADSLTREWREMLKRIAPQSNGFTAIDVPASCLTNNEYVLRLKNYVETFKPGYVVFDSLYRLVGDNINTAKVLTFITLMNDICCFVDKTGLEHHIPWMLIHHPPHHESRAAGHSSLGANNSNEWSLLKTKLKIEKGRLVSDKEILLSRDVNGLWELYTPPVHNGAVHSTLYNKLL